MKNEYARSHGQHGLSDDIDVAAPVIRLDAELPPLVAEIGFRKQRNFVFVVVVIFDRHTYCAKGRL